MFLFIKIQIVPRLEMQMVQFSFDLEKKPTLVFWDFPGMPSFQLI